MESSKFFQLTVLFYVVFALPLVKSHYPINITTGSSVSTSPNQTCFWLSPSTNFALGFYPISSEYHQYVIGIWLTRTNDIVLVWSTTLDDYPLSGSYSSMTFSKNGFTIQTSSEKEGKQLFNLPEAKFAFYALMQDNGNLVMYDLYSRVIWQSFDYPTDTLLPGQVLKSKQSLVSSDSKRYSLTVQEDGDIVVFEGNKHLWSSKKRTKRHHNMTLNLDLNGHLDVGGSKIIKNFTVDEYSNGSVLYRAKLEESGSFCLYRERIGVKSEESIMWDSSSTTLDEDIVKTSRKLKTMWIGLLVCTIVCIIRVCICKRGVILVFLNGLVVFLRDFVASLRDLIAFVCDLVLSKFRK